MGNLRKLMMQEPGPDTPSSDYEAMAPYWRMVGAMIDGADAMRAAGELYLPRFGGESADDYEFRRKHAKFTNIFRDIVENLAAKPFSRELKIAEGSASTAIQTLVEDIDGLSNHLHVFAGNVFFAGIANAIDWILVDKTKVPEGARSRRDEAQIGARPYWVRIPAIRMLAVYSAIVGGREEIIHARVLEPAVIRNGYGEKTVKRVRVFNRVAVMDGDRVASLAPATYELFEEVSDKYGKKEWVIVESGEIAIGAIPLVPFITGRRKDGAWRFYPPMQDAAFLQVEHYQQETALKYAATNTAFPMLAGNGVPPPRKADGTIENAPVGPKRVLYAPPNPDGGSHGEWKFIEPTAASLKFLAEQIDVTEKQLRELGRQPLTAQSGNLTVITTAFASQKGSSAVQAWALSLKDTIENALALTCQWIGDSSHTEVIVHTDFAIDVESEKATDALLTMRENSDISRKALVAEAKRRDWLSAEYDAEQDAELIAAEMVAKAAEMQAKEPQEPPQAA